MKRGRLLVVVGKPGSGKSTVAALAAGKVTGSAHFSVGDELRAIGLHGKRSALSRELARYSAELRLHLPVPFDLATRVFEACTANAKADSVIVDGYPQYTDLLAGFEDAVGRLRLDVVGVSHISVTDAVAGDRLRTRPQRLTDVVEDENYIGRRLSAYQENTVPAIEALTQRHPVITIDGSRSKKDVASRLARILAARHG